MACEAFISAVLSVVTNPCFRRFCLTALTANLRGVCNSMPRNRVFDHKAEVSRGSHHDNRSVIGNEAPSKGHYQFYTEHSDDSHDPSEQHAASFPSSPKMGYHQSYMDYKLRFILNATINEDLDAVLAKRRRLNAHAAATKRGGMDTE